MLNTRKCLLAVSVVGALCVASIAAPAAFAIPITFATSADYDNSASQTTGVFRDVLDGAEINRGNDVGGTGHTALNFTGSDSNAGFGFQGRVAVYDTTPASATPTTFTGNFSASADILIHNFNNAKGAGLLTLFNEGGTNDGLALFLSDAGNSDASAIKLVQQSGVASANLSAVSLGSSIVENLWYRLTLALAFTGSDFTVTGTVFGHTIGTDPNSALGAQIGSTLTYNGTLGSGLSDPYEIGLVARGVSAVVDTSVTNFDFSGGGANRVTATVPEPGTMLLLGIGLVGLIGRARKRLKQ